MASKEVDGSDPLNSIAMCNCYVEIVISTIRLYSLPLFFHRIYREPLYGTMLGPRAAERGSGTWADGGHRRQLGQESGRSRAAARGSPKSPTPPSSPHLAVPPPALLHAPTPLPRYLERCHPAAAGWVGEGEQTLDQKTLSRGSWSHHSLHRRGTAGSQHGPDAAVQNH